jgi:hypothetical protein
MPVPIRSAVKGAAASSAVSPADPGARNSRTPTSKPGYRGLLVFRMVSEKASSGGSGEARTWEAAAVN